MCAVFLGDRYNHIAIDIALGMKLLLVRLLIDKTKSGNYVS
ncbi:hypothetical protein NXG27_02480 [Megasphaera paucivorans]|nr:hypothetical protein [Megasphaera paucivorans]